LPYLFALLSVILLLPIVMFLNIGISKKGKLLIILIGLFIAVLGTFSQLTYPLWQVAISLLLLIAISTYFLTERFNTLLVDTKKTLMHHDEVEKLTILEDDEDEIVQTQTEGNYPEMIEMDDFVNYEGAITPLAEVDKNVHEELTAKVDQNEIEPFIPENNSLDQQEVIHLIEPDDSYERFDEVMIEIKEQENERDFEKEIDFEEIEILPSKIIIIDERNDNPHFEDEIEEIDPELLTRKVELEDEERLEFVDEIVPIQPTTSKNSVDITKNPEKDMKVKYLSEIEKLLEED
jgi:hypothetical protein